MELILRLSDKEYEDGLRLHNISGYAEAVKILQDAFLRGAISCDTPIGRLESWITPVTGYDAPSAGVVLFPNAGEGELVDLVNVDVNGPEGNIEMHMYADPYTEDYTHKSIIKAEEWKAAFGLNKE